MSLEGRGGYATPRAHLGGLGGVRYAVGGRELSADKTWGLERYDRRVTVEELEGLPEARSVSAAYLGGRVVTWWESTTSVLIRSAFDMPSELVACALPTPATVWPCRPQDSLYSIGGASHRAPQRRRADVLDSVSCLSAARSPPSTGPSLRELLLGQHALVLQRS